jgi:hypothetical protein
MQDVSTDNRRMRDGTDRQMMERERERKRKRK